MILVLLEDIHGSDFRVEQLLNAQDRLTSLTHGITNGTVDDLNP
jgi:hypothetical protein